MSRAQARGLIVLGLLVAGGLVLWAVREPPAEPGFELEAPAVAPAEAGSTPDAPMADAQPDAAPPQGRGDGIPRVLPPDAAIEDVRDALALEGAARTVEVQQAYEAIRHLARESAGVRQGLVRHLERVEDPVARGVVLAALGAERSAENVAWLAARLREASAPEERLGAFFGLAGASSKLSARSDVLAGLGVPLGGLPGAPHVLEALAGWFDQADGDFARDSLALMRGAVGREPAIASLLVVVDEGRPCRLYSALDEEQRRGLREAALQHDALPGAVRRVLERAP